MYAAVFLGRLACEGMAPAIRLALLVVLGGCAYSAALLLLDRRIVPDIRHVLRAMRT
jgi:hypothetical protein